MSNSAESGTVSAIRSTGAEAGDALDRRINAARLTGQRLGESVLLLMSAPRYKHVSLGDLDWLVLPPLMANQLIVAQMAPSQGARIPAPVGIAMWACVSSEVELKIKEQVRANVFPVRLKPEEWTSGNRVWLMDIVAPTRTLATKLFGQFQQLEVGSGPIQMHPIVGKLIDAKVLSQLNGSS